MLSVIHDPVTASTPGQLAESERRKERLQRIQSSAFHYVAPQPIEPVKIEIEDHQPEQTSIEVRACNGQIVIVTQDQIAEARAIFERATSNIVTVEKIQRAVCARFGIKRSDMLSVRRTKDLVVPRQVAMYLAKTLTLKSLPEIGRRFCGKDHTTVLHAVRKMQALVNRDDTIRSVVDDLKAVLVAEVA